MQNLTGQLLVASPSLLDPNFRQTVILMVQDTEDGALGVILNRPSDKSVKNLWEVIFHQACETDQFLRLGGPVFGPLMVVHTRRELADIEIGSGLFFSSQKDYIESLVNQNIQPFQLFLGHAGWSEGQLRSEIREGAWFMIPSELEFVFGDLSDLWQRSLQIAGRMSLARVIGNDHLPDDPLTN